MKLLTQLLFLLLLPFVVSCKKQTSRVLVGFQMIETDPIRGDFISDNNLILSFDGDSLEVIPLWQGCIIAPANSNKYLLQKNRAFSSYMVSRGDTVSVDMDHIGSDIYAHRIDRSSYQYSSILDVSPAEEEAQWRDLLQEKSYRLSVEETIYTISFHEHEFLMNQQKGTDRYVKRGTWFIKKVQDYYFLILDDWDSILKFQLLGQKNNEIGLYDLNPESRGEIGVLKPEAGYLSIIEGAWLAETEVTLLGEKQPLGSAYWLWANDVFMAEDTVALYNYSAGTGNTAYLDRGTQTILMGHELMFYFRPDITNNRRITLFPVDEYGKVYLDLPKVYSLTLENEWLGALPVKAEDFR